MSDELKACPFCGKVDSCYVDFDDTLYECKTCGATCHSLDDWNGRPLEDALRAEIADLEHNRRDNTALLWKVEQQQREIERLRAEIAAYIESNPVLRDYSDDSVWDGKL